MPGRPGFGREDGGVGAEPRGERDVRGHTPPRLGGVGGIPDQIDRPSGKPRGEQIDQFPGQLWLPGPLGVGFALRDLLAARLPEPEQHRQAHRALEEREPHDDPDHNPIVAPSYRRPVAVGGRVVVPEAAVDLPAQTVQKRVVNGDKHRRARLDEPLDDQHRQPQPELVHRPASLAEEPVRAAVMPHPRQPRPHKHPSDGPKPRLRNLADHKHSERLERRAGETRTKQEQQRIQRRRHAGHRR